MFQNGLKDTQVTIQVSLSTSFFLDNRRPIHKTIIITYILLFSFSFA